MWTPVWEELPIDLRFAVRRALTPVALTYLAQLTSACSAHPGSPQIYGTVTVNVSVPASIKTAGGTYLVSNDAGEPVRFGTLTSALVPIQLTLPQGPDYVLSVNTLGRKRRSPISLECEGFRKFDVIRLRHTEINLMLDCGDLWPEEPPPEPPPMTPACGIEALVVGPLRQMVGATVHANVTATAVESRFTWLTSDSDVGHFTHPTSDSVSQTGFSCDAVGNVTLTLVVASEGCSDEASVQVSCLPWSETDAGTY
jgi:hypothetical protein